MAYVKSLGIKASLNLMEAVRDATVALSRMR
jgi:hypothetical protein